MILTICKWGNSQGIRFPKDILKKIHADVGTDVKVECTDGKITIEPAEPEKKYSIHDLVKEIPPDYRHEEIDWGKPEGGEIW